MEIFTKVITVVLSLAGALGLGQLIHFQLSKKQTPQEKHNAAECLNDIFKKNEMFLLQSAYQFYTREKYVPSVDVIKFLLSSANPFNMIEDYRYGRDLCSWDGKKFYIRQPKFLLFSKILYSIFIAIILVIIIFIVLLAVWYQKDLKTQLVFSGLFLIVSPFAVAAFHFCNGKLNKISAAERLTGNIKTKKMASL